MELPSAETATRALALVALLGAAGWAFVARASTRRLRRVFDGVSRVDVVRVTDNWTLPVFHVCPARTAAAAADVDADDAAVVRRANAAEDATAPLVLLIHGLTANRFTFAMAPSLPGSSPSARAASTASASSDASMAAALVAAGCRVRALELRGGTHARRADGDGAWRKRTWTFDDHVADVRTVLAHLNERVLLVGHSMGGNISLAVAALEPSRVAGVVTLGTSLRHVASVHARGVAAGVKSTRSLLPDWLPLRNGLINQLMALPALALGRRPVQPIEMYGRRGGTPPRFQAHFFLAGFQTVSLGAIKSMRSATEASGFAFADGTPHADALGGLGAHVPPLLIVGGGDDEQAPPADVDASVAMLLDAGVPSTRVRSLIVEDYGHFDLFHSLTAAERVFEPVIDFIRETTRGK